MGDIKYVNKSVRTYEDEKIKIIESMPDADAILVIWDKLILMAGKNAARGMIYMSEGKPYTDEMLASILNRPLNTVRLAINTFQELGMINSNGQGIYLINFAKWQNIDALTRIRESTRDRVRKFRDKQKGQQPLLTSGNVTDTLRNDIEGEGEGEGEGELEIEEELENSSNSKNINTKDTINQATVEGEGAKIKIFSPAPSLATLPIQEREENNKRIFKKLHKVYPEAFGKEPGAREIAQIRDYAEELSQYPGCTDEMIEEAFKEAATHNKLFLTYAYRIIQDWIGVER